MQLADLARPLAACRTVICLAVFSNSLVEANPLETCRPADLQARRPSRAACPDTSAPYVLLQTQAYQGQSKSSMPAEYFEDAVVSNEPHREQVTNAVAAPFDVGTGSVRLPPGYQAARKVEQQHHPADHAAQEATVALMDVGKKHRDTKKKGKSAAKVDYEDGESDDEDVEDEAEQQEFGNLPAGAEPMPTLLELQEQQRQAAMLEEQQKKAADAAVAGKRPETVTGEQALLQQQAPAQAKQGVASEQRRQEQPVDEAAAAARFFADQSDVAGQEPGTPGFVKPPSSGEQIWSLPPSEGQQPAAVPAPPVAAPAADPLATQVASSLPHAPKEAAAAIQQASKTQAVSASGRGAYPEMDVLHDLLYKGPPKPGHTGEKGEMTLAPLGYRYRMAFRNKDEEDLAYEAELQKRQKEIAEKEQDTREALAALKAKVYTSQNFSKYRLEQNKDLQTEWRRANMLADANQYKAAMARTTRRDVQEQARLEKALQEGKERIREDQAAREKAEEQIVKDNEKIQKAFKEEVKKLKESKEKAQEEGFNAVLNATEEVLNMNEEPDKDEEVTYSKTSKAVPEQKLKNLQDVPIVMRGAVCRGSGCGPTPSRESDSRSPSLVQDSSSVHPNSRRQKGSRQQGASDSGTDADESEEEREDSGDDADASQEMPRQKIHRRTGLGQELLPSSWQLEPGQQQESDASADADANEWRQKAMGLRRDDAEVSQEVAQASQQKVSDRHADAGKERPHRQKASRQQEEGAGADADTGTEMRKGFRLQRKRESGADADENHEMPQDLSYGADADVEMTPTSQQKSSHWQQKRDSATDEDAGEEVQKGFHVQQEGGSGANADASEEMPQLQDYSPARATKRKKATRLQKEEDRESGADEDEADLDAPEMLARLQEHAAADASWRASQTLEDREDAGQGQQLGPQHSRCTPTCTWQCSNPRCEQECKPTCEAPRCQTRCTRMNTTGCVMECAKPQCAVICPKNRCASPGCPLCVNTCSKPMCKLQCPNEQPCFNACEAPKCEFKCKAPKSCPKPKCKMVCETSRMCKGLTWNTLPPLEPGESLVQSFAAPHHLRRPSISQSSLLSRRGLAQARQEPRMVDVPVQSMERAAPQESSDLHSAWQPQQRTVSMPAL